MAKSEPQPDVLVLGEHPCAYLAGALLKQKTKLNVLHATIPDDHAPDHLVLINPALFDLHPLLGSLKRKLTLTPIYGLQFLSDDPEVRSEHRSKSAMAFVTSYKGMRAAMLKLAEAEGVELANPKQLTISAVHEKGLDVVVGKSEVHATVLILAGRLPDHEQRMLGLPEAWEREVLHRYTFAKLKRGVQIDLGSRPAAPMSLDLDSTLNWGWLLGHEAACQISIEQTLDGPEAAPATQLLQHWVNVLRRHGVIREGPNEAFEEPETLVLPLAGAMAHEGVHNRTLLIGPAGGFYSACAEDMYPNCWSALFAVDVVKKALKEPHLQDAIQAYRQKWRTTLGDYLRGPQQNLRFLLPLVYRNQVMTTRLAESILLGKSVVR